jgi:hypothetical protein
LLGDILSLANISTECYHRASLSLDWSGGCACRDSESSGGGLVADTPEVTIIFSRIKLDSIRASPVLIQFCKLAPRSDWSCDESSSGFKGILPKACGLRCPQNET